jgi:hypothetical protein
MSEGVMGYVETLFGHQDTILGLDALRAETTVSAGGRDKTVRFWKIVQETQLVFRGGGRSRLRDVLDGGLDALDERDEMVVDGEHTKGAGAVSRGKSYVEGSIECVSMIDESTFVSGGDSGCVCSSPYSNRGFHLNLATPPPDPLRCGPHPRKSRYSRIPSRTVSTLPPLPPRDSSRTHDG